MTRDATIPIWRDLAPRSDQGYCSRCNVTVRDIFAHRSGAEHRRAMSGIVATPGGSASYNPRRTAAAQAYASLRRWEEQYDA